MKKIIEERVDGYIMTKIEYFNYMKISYEAILENVLRKKSNYEYNKELVDFYMGKYQETNINFIRLTTEVIRSINEKYLGSKFYYDFNFEESTVTIFEREENDEKSKMGAISRPCCKNNVELQSN